MYPSVWPTLNDSLPTPTENSNIPGNFTASQFFRSSEEKGQVIELAINLVHFAP